MVESLAYYARRFVRRAMGTTHSALLTVHRQSGTTDSVFVRHPAAHWIAAPDEPDGVSAIRAPPPTSARRHSPQESPVGGADRVPRRDARGHGRSGLSLRGGCGR